MIKKALIFLVLTLGFSFSVFSKNYYLIVDPWSPHRDCKVEKGDVVADGFCFTDKLRLNRNWSLSNSDGFHIALFVRKIESCPAGEYLMADGKCDTCPVDKPIYNESTRTCLPRVTCSDSKGKTAPWPQGQIPDDGKPLTTLRQYCVIGRMCEAVAGYYANSDGFGKDSFFTGNDCVGDENDYADCPYYGGCDGATPPEDDQLEEPWEGCEKPYVEQPFVCRKDTDGDGRPNPDAEYDDAAICDYDSNGKFSCSLGSFDPDPDPDPDPEPDPEPDPTEPDPDPTEPDGDISNPDNIPDASGDPTNPEGVDPEKEVTEPELTPDSNGDIVKAIANMNRDSNKALRDLNIDINKSQADINTQLDRLNKNVVNNSNATRDLAQTNIDIYKNTKSLIQGVETAVKTGTQQTVEAIESSGNATNAALEKGFSDVNGSLEDIKGSLDGLSNVDTGSAGTTGTCIQNSSCTGFYTSSYPDGLSGVANSHFQSIKSNVLDGFVDTFGNLDLSNAKKPSFTIPVLDFGDYNIEDYLNLDWIFGFVRFCLIFTAIATARKNILGG
tara:strand:- start:4662 stop:6326 length:1665 start_codon:yes stop_codon:yes gene_type:complete